MTNYSGGFQILMDLYNHMKAQRPVLDKKKKFMFFGNHKVALVSVNRGVLKDRVILYKSHKDTYDKIFDNYPIEKAFKFTIVRNPFSRVRSAFFYTRAENRLKKNRKFRDFIKTDFKDLGTSIDIHFHEMHPNAFFNGKQFVDYIAKLENIKNDWKVIAKNIGCQSYLPNIHPGLKYKYKLDNEAIQIIANVYSKDLKYFGYGKKNS